jgi:hypothetical protein
MEDMRKECKSHRNIHDIEMKFLTEEMDEDEEKRERLYRNKIPDLPGYIKNIYMK